MNRFLDVLFIWFLLLLGSDSLSGKKGEQKKTKEKSLWSQKKESSRHLQCLPALVAAAGHKPPISIFQLHESIVIKLSSIKEVAIA